MMISGARLNMFAMGLVIICILFGSMGQISMKTGMSQINKINNLGELINIGTMIEIFRNKFVLGGLLFYTFSTILWLGALSSLDVSFMYPLLSLAYVLTALFAFIYLGETVPMIRWAGIFLVIIGCLLIVRS